MITLACKFVQYLTTISFIEISDIKEYVIWSISGSGLIMKCLPDLFWIWIDYERFIWSICGSTLIINNLPDQLVDLDLIMNCLPELKTLEWWISGLMLNPLFFLISRLNNACYPLILNLQINYSIRIKDIPFKSFQLWSISGSGFNYERFTWSICGSGLISSLQVIT